MLDCFVAKFDKFGALEWSRYLGGSEDDYASAIGYTMSNDFPMLRCSSSSNGTSYRTVSFLSSILLSGIFAIYSKTGSG